MHSPLNQYLAEKNLEQLSRSSARNHKAQLAHTISQIERGNRKSTRLRSLLRRNHRTATPTTRPLPTTHV